VPEKPITVTLEPFGNDPARLQEAVRALMGHNALRERLQDGAHRLLYVTPVDQDSKGRLSRRAPEYDATIYDYAEQRTIIARFRPDSPDKVEVSEYAIQPLPSADEFAEALDLLGRDDRFGAELRNERLIPYRPMPPTIAVEQPDGRTRRILAIGMHASDNATGHRIVGVDLSNRTILHDLPSVVHAGDGECGPPASYACSSGGANMARVTVRQGNTTLWRFIAVRPSASLGTNGSGIELRNVTYRGKSVLYRAQLPILNVKYDADGVGIGCGPTYRDWQNSETCFEAIGSDPVPGFRLCTSPALTILDTGSDAGNFSGVAIYVDGQEVILVSELQAGWYRYISMWRFHTNGTIRPRFGFAAANNRCTCRAHHHHCYWRLDFDIGVPSPNVVEEFNDPPIFPGMNWHRKTYEIRRLKDPARHRRWRVLNPQTGTGYNIIPGANGGVADSYGVGDLWVLRYRGSTPPPSGELDDGQTFTTSEPLSMAHIDRFNNGEVVENQDVVIWYAAHFLHDEQHGGGSHIVGPDLEPFGP
jgi:hypothetical protein